MAKHLAKTLDGKPGTLINVSSGNGLFTSPGQSSYCCNKAAGVRIIEQLHVGSFIHPSHPIPSHTHTSVSLPSHSTRPC